mmetsp:Transcript_4164/g.6500  ORF Transcript_4164/g.6500 Transcript_4164/m.6500 type:complete len:117 (+) Transcript_4164:254-604(+)
MHDLEPENAQKDDDVCLESEVDNESFCSDDYRLCDSSEIDVFYILIIIGLSVAAILVCFNFFYWVSALITFGNRIPKYLSPIKYTGWLVPPLGILLYSGAELANQNQIQQSELPNY